MITIKVLALQETNYINEWLGMLKNHRIRALLIRPNERLMSIKSYYSYSEKHVKPIYLPYKIRGRGVASVGIFDHIFYTLSSIALIPAALMHDVIVFVTPSYFHTVTIPILKLFGKKVYVVVLDPQEVLKKNAESSLAKKIYYDIASYLEYMTIKKSDKVFAVSTYLCNQYKKLNKNVFYVPNGADVDYIDKIKPKKILGKTCIAFFGSLDHWRGVDILVEAFMKIKKKYKINLLLLGGGKEEEKIRNMCKGHDNIYISGFIRHKDAIALCKGSQILVIPFRKSPMLYKTMPIKTFEYVACGVPVVTTDTGEHADIIQKLGVGIATEPTPKNIANGLEKLLGNKSYYNKLKNNCTQAKSKVDYKFTRRLFVQEFENSV